MFLTLICLHIGPWHWHHKTKTSSILIPISFLQKVLKKDKKKKKVRLSSKVSSFKFLGPSPDLMFL